MQQAELGDAVPIGDDLDGLLRGDLVFWTATSASCSTPSSCCTPMPTTWPCGIEPLRIAADRIAQTGSAIATVSASMVNPSPRTLRTAER